MTFEKINYWSIFNDNNCRNFTKIINKPLFIMEDKVTISQVGLRYGIIIGLIMIVYSMILQFTGQVANNWLASVSYIFLIVAIVLAHKAFKEGGDGFMSIGQGLGIGTLISIVAGVLSTIFSYIYVKFIDDSMLSLIQEKQIEAMEKQGLDDAQIEQAMEMAGKFSSPEVLFGIGIIVFIFFGFILSLIVSLFTKKANPALEV